MTDCLKLDGHSVERIAQTTADLSSPASVMDCNRDCLIAYAILVLSCTNCKKMAIIPNCDYKFVLCICEK